MAEPMIDPNEPSDDELRRIGYEAYVADDDADPIERCENERRALFNAGRTFERSQQAEEPWCTQEQADAMALEVERASEPPRPVMTSAPGEELVSWVAAHGDVVLDALDLYRWQLHAAGALAVELRALLLECGRAPVEKEEEKPLPACPECGMVEFHKLQCSRRGATGVVISAARIPPPGDGGGK